MLSARRSLVFMLAFLVAACIDGSMPEGALTVAQAKDAIGEYATVCGKVSTAAQFKQMPDKPAFINLGKPFPNQEFTILIPGVIVDQMNNPEVRFKQKQVCVTGTIEDGGGIPLINLSDPEQVIVIR
jgi:hypothetical protein